MLFLETLKEEKPNELYIPLEQGKLCFFTLLSTHIILKLSFF